MDFWHFLEVMTQTLSLCLSLVQKFNWKIHLFQRIERKWCVIGVTFCRSVLSWFGQRQKINGIPWHCTRPHLFVHKFLHYKKQFSFPSIMMLKILNRGITCHLQSLSWWSSISNLIICRVQRIEYLVWHKTREKWRHERSPHADSWCFYWCPKMMLLTNKSADWPHSILCKQIPTMTAA